MNYKKLYSFVTLFCLFSKECFSADQSYIQCGKGDIYCCTSCCCAAICIHAACASTTPATYTFYTCSAAASCIVFHKHLAEAYIEYKEDQHNINLYAQNILINSRILPAQISMQTTGLPARQNPLQ